jgi:L-amino acid N-acyltransferase YncA
MISIRPLHQEHWPRVRRIYAEGIATGNATFETTVPGWDAFDSGHLSACRLVAVEGDSVLGWAALSPVSSRCVYGGVAEVTVYVADAAQGRGVGSRLLQALITASEEEGIWTLQAGIFPENVASVALHRKLGFREVGRRERLGRLQGRWRDVLLLERRSRKVGRDDDPGQRGEGATAPASGTPPFPEPLVRFVELFNRRAFWESHEVLEGPWREGGSDFYHGLILYASAFVHVQRGNPHGIAAQLGKAGAALAPFAPGYLGVDVSEILDRIGIAGDEVEREAPVAFPSIRLDPSRVRGDEPELGGQGGEP